MTTGTVSPRRAQTRERLLAAARTVFAERGVHGATVEDICDAAGFTRGAFYSNFTSKPDLLFALLESERSRLMAQLARALTIEVPEGVDAMDHLLTQVLAAQPMDRQWYLVQMEIELQAVRDQEVARVLLQVQGEMYEELGRLVAAGLEMLGRRSALTPRELIVVLIGVYEAVFRGALIIGAADGTPRRAGDAQDVAATMRGVLLAVTEPVSAG